MKRVALERASILEKSRAWICPECRTRYPGEQEECVVCKVMRPTEGGEK
jgi:hypothetical protein